jgi:copper homeostasis protein CutC
MDGVSSGEEEAGMFCAVLRVGGETPSSCTTIKIVSKKKIPA